MRILHTLQAQFLVALAVIGLLPMGLVGFGVATLNRRALATQSARALTEAARGLAGQADGYLAGVFSTTQAIAALPAIVSMDQAAHEVLLKELFHHYHTFARLSTFDGTGQRVASSQPGGATFIGLLASFQTAWQQGRQAWEVAPAPSTGRPALLIYTPIRDAERQLVGVLGAVVDLESFATVISRVYSAGNGRAFILDATGRVLVHPESEAIQAQRDYSWLGVPTGGRPAGPGTVRYTLDNTVRIAGYASIPVANWTAVVERPERTVLEPTRRPWQLALSGLALSAALALGAAWFLARTLTRPVRNLAQAAHALGAGEPAVALPALGPEHGELGMLVMAFAAMRDSVAEREAGLRQLATEKEQAEGTVRRLNAELEQRVRERTAALEASNKELEAFAYSVSHDLRAPLRGVDGFSNILLEEYADKLDRQGVHYLQRVRAASQRMGHLIDALLYLSRVTRSELHRTTLDMSLLAQTIVSELHDLQAERQVAVRITPGLLVCADAPLLHIMLENLLGNAWKFTGKQPQAQIEFGVTQHEEERTYFVRDNGAGFDMVYANKLFGAFQRLHTVTEFEGTGIGLATVQRIVHRHGGRVWAEGTVGQGATVYFTLPD